MRFATRTFLFSFVPFAVLLMGSFWVIQRMVESTVRDGLRTSLRNTHDSIARVRSKSELQNSRFLRVLGENATLKAGLQLLHAERKSGEARLTVEDQLRDLCKTLGFDFLLVSDADGTPLAGVMRVDDQLVAMEIARIRPPQQGFVMVGDRAHDAMTSDRPYRLGMSHEEAIRILEKYAGTQFDASIVSIFAQLSGIGRVDRQTADGNNREMRSLAEAVNAATETRTVRSPQEKNA